MQCLIIRGGGRGYSPYTRAGGYIFHANYTQDENKRLLYGIIIESELGIKNLPEIVKDTNLDLVYLGAYDISLALGYPGQTNHIKVISKITECIKIIVEAGKAAGCMIHGKEDYELFASLGVKFFVYKVDSAVIYDGVKLLNAFTGKARVGSKIDTSLHGGK